MAEVSAALVKDLRTKTGAGMMDCKKALAETAGDVEAAIDWLRKKGLSTAAKKAGRVAAEGLVAVSSAKGQAAIVEVNSETDFVARNPSFQELAKTIADLSLGTDGSLEAVSAKPFPGAGRSVAEQITHLVATIGENMNLRRVSTLSVDTGVVASYVHGPVAPGLGRIGVLVALKSAGDAARLEAFGRQIAMHIAAANPISLDVDGVDPSELERERAVLVEQARASGKPENIIDKMVEGRIRKFYEEVVLLEQVWVIDNETKVRKAAENLGKELGTPVEIAGFIKFVIGEGIEKEKSDFAAEVAAQAGL